MFPSKLVFSGKKVFNINNLQVLKNEKRTLVTKLSPVYDGSPDPAMSSLLSSSLKESDPQLYELLKNEKKRQRYRLEMFASENFTSAAVLEVLGSCLSNKYSEGLPGARYYGGNEYIDKIELLCQQRALEAFDLDPELWGCNVQPFSGAPANLAVYTALLQPHDRIMGLDMPDGGHRTHGSTSVSDRFSATSFFFETMPYKVDPVTERIDYNRLAENARLFKPKIIVAGISCYPRFLDYKRFREIANENEAYLFSDMAHIAGLVAAKVIPSPFEYSDIVSTTTNKTLRAARGGIIFFRKGLRSVGKNGEKVMYDLESKVNSTVFPALQGGPHNHQIGAVATALLQASTPEFRQYQQQVLKNAKALCAGLQQRGYRITTNGTDIHMLVVDMRSVNLNGMKGEFILEEINISCNKTAVGGEKNTGNPSGVRLGTAAMTTRGLVERDMEKVLDFIDRGFKLAQEAELLSGPELSDFKNVVLENKIIAPKVQSLRIEVEEFSAQFSFPSFHEL